MKLKKLTALITAFTLTLSLAACGSNKEDASKKEESKATIATEVKEPVTIEFWHAMNGDNEAALKEITEEFNKKIRIR